EREPLRLLGAGPLSRCGCSFRGASGKRDGYGSGSTSLSVDSLSGRRGGGSVGGHGREAFGQWFQAQEPECAPLLG
ncbi:hypothetical protein HYT92_00125, partial [Candidatus Pacearchaeota archaeon]|nr:hypothetical protein [Candidatus Pacearchaeota archaeon]